VDFETFSLIFQTIFCVRVRVLDRTVWTCYGFTSFWLCDDSQWNEMKFKCYLCSWLEIWTVSSDPWLWIFSGKLVSLLSFFLRSGSCEILHLFSFFFSDPQPVITLVARCFRRRARVELQVQQFSDEDSRESLRIARSCIEFIRISLLFVSVKWIQWWIQRIFVKLFCIGTDSELGFVYVLEFLVNFGEFDL